MSQPVSKLRVGGIVRSGNCLSKNELHILRRRHHVLLCSARVLHSALQQSSLLFLGRFLPDFEHVCHSDEISPILSCGLNRDRQYVPRPDHYIAQVTLLLCTFSVRIVIISK
eukprot:TRINITY_DN11962_c0_g1_i1.p1 TRINITY_DN11962_c0_g1~~TRINITY_DN11962_c0_g1_i1.p1  ORF type:complete len:131 (-),score=0.95 TRINITY_DN11962_c0_g1_i1:120-455(-)